MGKLEMRGWAIRYTAPGGEVRLWAGLYLSRQYARTMARILRRNSPPYRYTVVPVIVRERR